ncbi:MAG: hypothetical protein KBA11_07830 [Sedimentibacter sp.]|nr:hypothetical protein [Sedimentibacter sp.]
MKNEAFKTTFATTTGTTNTTTLALSGTIDKVYIKIPKVDASVRYAFEDKETGYRFLSGTVSGSASAVTITEVDLTDTRYSGVLELKLYCDRASADTQQSIIGNLIYY